MKKAAAKTKKILCIILTIALTAALFGCGTQKSEQEEVVDAFVKGFCSKDFEAMYNLTNDKYRYFDGLYDGENDNSVLLFDTMIKNLNFEVTKTEVSEDTANVYAHISTVNMYKVLSSLASSDNAASPNIIADTLKEYKDEKAEKDTVFNLIKQDGKWVIESNMGIYSDLTGGYLQYIYEISILGMTGEQAKALYQQSQDK